MEYLYAILCVYIIVRHKIKSTSSSNSNKKKYHTIYIDVGYVGYVGISFQY